MAARVLAPRLAGLPLPVELFYRGDVVRDEEIGVGRSREFSQVGAERYGDASFASDERMLGLLLACVAVPASRLTLRLGFAGLLDSLLAAVAPALTARDGARLANVVALCRERRVTAVAAALAKAGARPADAMTVARSLLVGFDPDSPLLAAPVLSEGAAALRRARDLARTTVPGAAVVIDLAGTPTAPYYTGLTYGLDVAGVAAPLAAGGRYSRASASPPPRSASRSASRPSPPRSTRTGSRRRRCRVPSGSRSGRGGSFPSRSRRFAGPGSTSRIRTDDGWWCRRRPATSRSCC
jgi:ATP phosphoribosyltransferase regulatory subunit